MARLVIVINVPDQTIQGLKDRTEFATKPAASIRGCVAVLEAIEGGTMRGSLQITVRDTAPTVATSGAGSVQNTFSKL